ncbi:hypothetical protein [Deinococcus ruber]|uniref:HYR domain-containing protein n=1 Tax=Deinococcus ruber TaxID=1848197 RepID=A0A918CJC8_9DEIO|nr:hypothetical protein [Deinococcus ruber]GGR24111.1 hypothetical protein GCM10008957_39890 [Deinococcus ruber]
MIRQFFMLVILLIGVLSACGSDPTPAPGDPSDPQSQAVIIPPTTKVADTATRAALSSYDADTGILTFTQSTPALASLKPGDVLASEPSSAAPSGYLRKVTGVRQEGSQTVLDTTQANLTDAITQGELDTDFQLTSDDLLRTEGLPEGVTLTATPAPTGQLKSLAGVGEQYSFNLNFDHTFLPVQGPNATGSIRVDGGVNFNVGYGVNVGIKPCFDLPPICVTSFQASVGFAQGSHLNITGDFHGVVGDAVLVGSQYFKPKVFFIGPVPVVLVPKVELYLTAGGEVTAHVEFAANESVTAQVGARWTRGNGWKDISGFGLNGDLSPPKFSGSLKPRVGVQSRASFTLYDVAGPEATLEGGVNLDVAYPRNPNWIVNGFLKGTLGFRVKLPILGTLASYSTTLFDISKELGRSGNTPPVLALTNQPHTVNVGELQNLRAFCTVTGPAFGNGEFYSASDAEDGCPQITVVSDVDGPLPADATFTAPGDRTLTVTAKDSQGASTSLRFTLSVINPPPTLKVNFSGDPHQGEDYLMSAAVADTNEPAGSHLCDFTTWAVDAPDTLSASGGCDIKVKFGATGARQVRVSVHDSFGAVTSQTVTVTVLPPPANPYPVIKTSGVYTLGGTYCGEYAVSNGSTLDFTSSTSCTANTARYTAKATIDNPQQEALTYDWKFIVQYQGKDTVFSSSQTGSMVLNGAGGGFNNGKTTTPCRVILTVGAPDPGRSKTLTVWSGLCSYYTFRLA